MRTFYLCLVIGLSDPAFGAPCGARDSDSDGILDVNEDRDGDGDCDNDDTDGDGTPDYRDGDDDGDGIDTLIEGKGDVDGVPPMGGSCDGWGGLTCDLSMLGDGVPNYLDLDSDGDGIPDAVEGLRDPDVDNVEGFRDCDDCDGPFADPDGDGIKSVYEDAIGTNPRNPDSDGDGVWDADESVKLSETRWTNKDTDGDGTSDALDTDDDGDGILTQDEDYNERDGRPGDGNPMNDDFDADGVADYLDDDDDDDGVPTRCEPALSWHNIDSDDDGINDLVEWDFEAFRDARLPDFTTCTPMDTDGDKTPDLLDDDDDGDGLLTIVEGTDDVDGVPPQSGACNTWGAQTCDLSAPGDGWPNYLDTDSDGDGVLDADELGDVDEDGVEARLDCDDCPWPRAADTDEPEEHDTDDAVEPVTPKQCACAAGPVGPWFALLLLPAMLRRRR